MSMTCALDDIENKHDVYRGKDFMKTFYESSNKLAMKIVNFEKKRKMILSTNKELVESCQKKFEDKYADGKKYNKVGDHYTGKCRGTSKRVQRTISMSRKNYRNFFFFLSSSKKIS